MTLGPQGMGVRQELPAQQGQCDSGSGRVGLGRRKKGARPLSLRMKADSLSHSSELSLQAAHPTLRPCHLPLNRGWHGMFFLHPFPQKAVNLPHAKA